ncbi:MAG: translation initiation factor IF-3 [FCB group bacterium]|nr:translation initiation factor IF-3 [FCB group bacterium]
MNPKGKSKGKSTRINQEIEAPQIRLIDGEGKQFGIVTPQKALQMAEEEGLDLVEIAPQATPPVCRLMDYGKFRYEQSKKEKDARRKQHTVQVKGIRLTPNIDDHDFNYKLEAARKFVIEGAKVKVSVLFRGRLITHKEFGFEILKRFAEGLEEEAKIESAPKMEGVRNMVMILTKK